MGFWLKWEKGLERKQEILQIAARLMLAPAHAAGALMLVMEWLDDNVSLYSSDGHALVTLKSLSPTFVDSIAGISGFGEAMAEVGWLRVENGVLQFVNAAKHNGITAKVRADAAMRQTRSRKTRAAEDRDIIPRPLRRLVYQRDQFRCAYCGLSSSARRENSESSSKQSLLSVDHVIPHVNGGETVEHNLVTCCKKCNREKNNRTPEEWGYPLAFLAPGVFYDPVTGLSQDSVTKTQPLSSALISSGRSNGKQSDVTVIPLLLSTDAFAEAWRDWLQHRREKKSPIPPGSQTERQQLKTLEQWGESRAIAAIRYTIFKGWQGIREPDPDDKEYASHSARNGSAPKPDIYAEPPEWRARAAAKWPGVTLPEHWHELSSALRNDLIAPAAR